MRGNKKISLAGDSAVELPPFTARAPPIVPYICAWRSVASCTLAWRLKGQVRCRKILQAMHSMLKQTMLTLMSMAFLLTKWMQSSCKGDGRAASPCKTRLHVLPVPFVT